jgi:hypothetical protein
LKAIHAIWKNGRVVPTEPVDWPDGTELTVEPVEEPAAVDSQRDILGSDPGSIARWLAWYDTLGPLIFTPEGEAAWQAARRERRDLEKSQFDERAEQLNAMFE